MLIQGNIEKAKLERFNLLYYAPTAEEVRDVIQNNVSFNIHEFETFEVDRDCNMGGSNKSFRYDKPTRDKCEAMSIRVVVEFILACYFGGEIKDDLFEIFSRICTQI